MNLHQAKQYLYNNLRFGEQNHQKNRVRYLAGLPFLHQEALTTLLLPDTTKVWGIDISHWNLPPIDLKRMAELYNLRFVIIKGCDGSLNSRYYLEHVATAKAAGLPWGMYNWLYPANKVNLDAQIATWYTRFSLDLPPLGMFIDAEWTNYGGLPANPNANDLRGAHDKWKNKNGQVATTYTAKGYADSYLIGFDWSREPLWAASWGGNSPVYPSGARTHKWWQFGILDGKQLDPTGNFELDGDYFNGTHEEFYQLYGGTTPPDGGTMAQYVKGTTKAADSAGGLKVRSATSTTSTILGYLPFGTPVEGWLENGWIKITYSGQIAYISAEWVTWVVADPPSNGGEVIDAVLTEKDASGAVVATWKGTLTKQS